MCGVAGIYCVAGVGAASDARAAADAMCAAMRHRGPDDAGSWLSDDGRAIFANVRLAIIDLSPAGHMPMRTPDGRVTITYNGELYNFAEIRRELQVRGHQFASGTDTEVILKSYVEWGPNCVRRFRGMYAFGLWDQQERRLLLARDRLGIKPLYYAPIAGGLAFASEIRTMFASGRVERRVRPEALASYLEAGSVAGPATVYEGVRLLGPGQMLLAQDGKIEMRTYWELPPSSRSAVSVAEATAGVRERLEEAVRLQLVSDAPLGAFLSGGIDSSAVVGLMRRASSGTIRTCSVVFSEASYDERPYARAVAEAYGCEHREVEVSADDVRRELPRAIGAMDQPTVDGLNSYFVSKAARESGLTVALSGLGGDELFGGYATFNLAPRVYRATRLAGRVPFATSAVAAVLRRQPLGSSLHRLGHAVSGPPSLSLAYGAVRGVFGAGGARALLHPDLVTQTPGDRGARLTAADGDNAAPSLGTGEDAWDTVSRLELRRYMHDQLLRDTDALSMAHSLEVRVPLLDENLVEYVLGLSPAVRSGGAASKSLLRAAVDDLLPPMVRLRTTKQGFTFPFGDWLKTSLKPILDDALDGASGRRSVFRRNAVEGLRADYERGRLHWSRVWAVAVLELWLRETTATTERVTVTRHG